MQKKTIVTALTITVLGAGLFGATQAFAQNSSTTQSPMSSLIQKLADKFGLNKNDVQAVFDQERQDRQAQMETRYLAKLDQEVKDGKITDAQKQLILAKHKELASRRLSDMQSMRDKTPAERKAAMQTRKQELETWAKQNNIDLHYLMPGNRFGMRGMGMHGYKSTAQ